MHFFRKVIWIKIAINSATLLTTIHNTNFFPTSLTVELRFHLRSSSELRNWMRQSAEKQRLCFPSIHLLVFLGDNQKLLAFSAEIRLYFGGSTKIVNTPLRFVLQLKRSKTLSLLFLKPPKQKAQQNTKSRKDLQ